MVDIFMEYILYRSRRKTLALRVTPDARLEARAPLNMPVSEIEAFILRKKTWIDKHLAAQKALLGENKPLHVDYGAFVPFKGKDYPIEARDATLAGFDGECFFLPPGKNPMAVKYSIIETYKKLAKAVFHNQIGTYGKIMGFYPSAMRITSAKTRWGSCSSNDSVSFSWLLVTADITLIDYVVVHELAHIKEHNHSPRFWALVESVLPDYKKREKKLQDLRAKLCGWI
jgi:predicted metal-dependent hydrolase